LRSRYNYGVRLRLQEVQGGDGDGERKGFRVDFKPRQILPEASTERDAETREGGG